MMNMCESSGREWCRDDSTARRLRWWPGGVFIFVKPKDLQARIQIRCDEKKEWKTAKWKFIIINLLLEYFALDSFLFFPIDCLQHEIDLMWLILICYTFEEKTSEFVVSREIFFFGFFFSSLMVLLIFFKLSFAYLWLLSWFSNRFLSQFVNSVLDLFIQAMLFI